MSDDRSKGSAGSLAERFIASARLEFAWFTDEDLVERTAQAHGYWAELLLASDADGRFLELSYDERDSIVSGSVGSLEAGFVPPLPGAGARPLSVRRVPIRYLAMADGIPRDDLQRFGVAVFGDPASLDAAVAEVSDAVRSHCATFFRGDLTVFRNAAHLLLSDIRQADGE